MAVQIIYFPHGTTEDNLNYVSTGWNPGVLSQKGIEQSILLKEQVDLSQFDVVFCSDLKRAIDSAELTFQGVVEIISDARIRECNYGDLNGASTKLVVYEDHITKPFPNGESLEDVLKRVKDFCAFLLENYDGKCVGVVAHKTPQIALDVLVKNLSFEEAIAKDWRKQKAWQPGFSYTITKDMI